ncbi:hypothetical protein [Mycoplasmopsis sturni]|uniref:hypothetical protein n=1 Tax=Mycoplasmopsis sturni TaxID=39047 RepID=UPI0005625E95|nr:hypothetical protein [Mycoplasmopsis sturni]
MKQLEDIIKKISNQEFLYSVKGYSIEQVDMFLEQIIELINIENNRLESLNHTLEYYEKEISNLIVERDELTHKIERLESEVQKNGQR